MILKASKAARSRATELLNAAGEGRWKTAETIATLNERIATEESEATAALQRGNVEEYQQHKASLEAAKEIKAAHEERAEILKHKALTTEEEYEEMVNAIIDEAKAQRVKAAKDIVDAINRAAEVAANLCEAYTDADEVLGVLQNDVYRNADRPHDSIGRPISWIGSKAIPLECWGIVEWIQGIIDNPTYRSCTNRDERGTLNIMEFKKVAGSNKQTAETNNTQNN